MKRNPYRGSGNFQNVKPKSKSTTGGVNTAYKSKANKVVPLDFGDEKGEKPRDETRIVTAQLIQYSRRSLQLEWLGGSCPRRISAPIDWRSTCSMIRDDLNTSRIGRRIVLPLSFTSGDRFGQLPFLAISNSDLQEYWLHICATAVSRLCGNCCSVRLTSFLIICHLITCI